MRSFYLFCWWPVQSVLPTVRSVQLTALPHRNSSPRTVCCSRMTCCSRIWTKISAPNTGSMVQMGKNKGSAVVGAYLFGRDKYRRLDRTQNVSWSAWAYLERPKSYQDRRHRRYIVIGSVVIGFGSWMSVCRTYLNRLLHRKYIVN